MLFSYSRLSYNGKEIGLSKTLFQVLSTLIQHAPADDPVFQFLDRKRQEGKHYYVYMTAAANKFLRIYYGTVMAYLEKL